jgi:hypothetical protein
MTDREQLKRLLVAESDLHRAVLRSECQRLGSVCSTAFRWQEGLRALSPRSPWWALGSAVVGLLLARRAKPILKWAPAAWTLWRWWRRHGRL